MDHLVTEHHSSMETTSTSHLHLAIFTGHHQTGGFHLLTVPSEVRSDAQALLKSTREAGVLDLGRGLSEDRHLEGRTGMGRGVTHTPPVGILGPLAHPRENPESFLEGVHIKRGGLEREINVPRIMEKLEGSLVAPARIGGTEERPVQTLDPLTDHRHTSQVHPHWYHLPDSILLYDPRTGPADGQ